MEPDDEMRITLDPHGAVMRVIVDGNLDFSTAASLRSCLEACAATPTPGCEVYLRRMGVVDSSGLGALLGGYRLFHDSARSFELLGDDESVARLLRRTALDGVLPLHRFHETPAVGAGRRLSGEGRRTRPPSNPGAVTRSSPLRRERPESD
jgi:anti-sigma B factor antagonist